MPLRAGAGGDPRAAFERAPLVLAESSPDTGVLTAFQRPLQAWLHDLAALADFLSVVDLSYRGPGVADRKEQLRVCVTAGGVVTPVHEVHSSVRSRSLTGPWGAPSCL